jgi:hypothetical protein
MRNWHSLFSADFTVEQATETLSFSDTQNYANRFPNGEQRMRFADVNQTRTHTIAHTASQTESRTSLESTSREHNFATESYRRPSYLGYD